ncbi:MAG: hypothetical protein KAS66_03985 [Candidatus Omnitrophica bacterium]|nr:hypothetical protein [Candidatus Omnitrophota bacterium]
MNDKDAIALIIFAAIMYGVGTVGASVLEEYATLIYFISGMVYAALGNAYLSYKRDEEDE